jgi:hypothetical protein
MEKVVVKQERDSFSVEQGTSLQHTHPTDVFGGMGKSFRITPRKDKSRAGGLEPAVGPAVGWLITPQATQLTYRFFKIRKPLLLLLLLLLLPGEVVGRFQVLSDIYL